MPFSLVAGFTIGGAALAVMTVVLVLFQTLSRYRGASRRARARCRCGIRP